MRWQQLGKGSLARAAAALYSGTMRFHPAVEAWFSRRFPHGPTDAQARGWDAIGSGQSTLIAAPTGSGKTLAAFLVCLDRLVRAANEPGEPLPEAERPARTQVVYVSPLKALGVDIQQNLEAPLREISALCLELGYRAPDVRVAVRSGDTEPGARGDAQAAARYFDHHAGVAVPAAHRREEPADAGEHAHRDRG